MFFCSYKKVLIFYICFQGRENFWKRIPNNGIEAALKETETLLSRGTMVLGRRLFIHCFIQNSCLLELFLAVCDVFLFPLKTYHIYFEGE